MTNAFIWEILTLSQALMLVMKYSIAGFFLVFFGAMSRRLSSEFSIKSVVRMMLLIVLIPGVIGASLDASVRPIAHMFPFWAWSLLPIIWWWHLSFLALNIWHDQSQGGKVMMSRGGA